MSSRRRAGTHVGTVTAGARAINVRVDVTSRPSLVLYVEQRDGATLTAEHLVAFLSPERARALVALLTDAAQLVERGGPP